MNDTDAIVRQAKREIARAPICTPGPDEYVDECHWSKTGRAIWKRADGETLNWCTCRPANSPADRKGEA